VVPQGVNLSGSTGAEHDGDRNGFGIQAQQLQQGPAVVVAGPLVIEDDQVGRKPLDLVVVVVVVGEERDGVTRVLQQVVDDEEDRWVRVDDEDVPLRHRVQGASVCTLNEPHRSGKEDPPHDGAPLDWMDAYVPCWNRG